MKSFLFHGIISLFLFGISSLYAQKVTEVYEKTAPIRQHLDPSLPQHLEYGSTGQIEAWRDFSGKRDHPQLLSGTPRYDAASFGGMGSVRLNGGASYELLNSSASKGILDFRTPKTRHTGFTVVFGLRLHALVSNWNDFLGNTSVPNTGGFGIRANQQGKLFAYLGKQVLELDAPLVKAGDEFVIALSYNADSGLLECASSLGRVATLPVAPADFSLDKPIRLGSFGANGRYTNGSFSEIMVFDRALSRAQLLLERDRMRTKWLEREKFLFQHLVAEDRSHFSLANGSSVTRWEDHSPFNRDAVPLNGITRYPSLPRSGSGRAGVSMGGAANALKLLGPAPQNQVLNFNGAASENSGFALLVALRVNRLHSDHNDIIGNESFIRSGVGMRIKPNGLPSAHLGGLSLNGTAALRASETVVFALNYTKSNGEMRFWDSKGRRDFRRLVPAGDFSKETDFTLGRLEDMNRFFDGEIFEVKLFKKALNNREFESERERIRSKWETPRLPIEVLGAEGFEKDVFLTFNEEQAGRARTVVLQVNNLSHQNKGSMQINGGEWITFNHQSVDLYHQEKARGGMTHGGYNTIRFEVPSRDLRPGQNHLRFRFNISDAISIGYRIVSLNLLDKNKLPLLGEAYFKEDDPLRWTAPIAGEEARRKGEALWHGWDKNTFAKNDNWDLWNHYKAPQQKGWWYGHSVPERKKMKANCADCHTQDGRDLEMFAYSNLSIVERAKFHGLNQREGENIASYIRSLSGRHANVERAGRPWNPPYQPGPKVARLPIHSWAAGAGLEAVLEKDADTIPYLFGVDSADDLTRNIVMNHFDSTKNIDRTIIPLAFQFPDWKHWLPKIHPMDAFTKDLDRDGIPYYLDPDYFGSRKAKDEPEKGIKDFRAYLNGKKGIPFRNWDTLDYMGRMKDVFWWPFRQFYARGATGGGHWRSTGGYADRALGPGVHREYAAASIAKLMAVKSFEYHNEFNLQDKARDYIISSFNATSNTKYGRNRVSVAQRRLDAGLDTSSNKMTVAQAIAMDHPLPRQWLGEVYNVYEVPPHFQASVAGVAADGGRVPGEWEHYYKQPLVTGFFESTNWYHVQAILNPGNGMMHLNSPVDFNYQPNLIRKFSLASGIQEPIRFFDQLNMLYQTKTWSGDTNPNDGLGMRIGQMTPRFFTGNEGAADPQDNDLNMNELLEQIKPQLSVWVLEALITQFVNEVTKRQNAIGKWYRANHPDGKSNQTLALDVEYAKADRKDVSKNIYDLIPFYAKKGVSKAVLNRLINWCDLAWPKMKFKNLNWLPYSTSQLVLEGSQLNPSGIRVVGTNLGSAPTYQWFVDGNRVTGSGPYLPRRQFAGKRQVECRVTSSETLGSAQKRISSCMVVLPEYSVEFKYNSKKLVNNQRVLLNKGESIEVNAKLTLEPHLWLDAMDMKEGNEPAGQSLVARWKNQTGSPREIPAANGSSPTYLRFGFHGKPAVQFGKNNKRSAVRLFASGAQSQFLENDWTMVFLGRLHASNLSTDMELLGNDGSGARDQNGFGMLWQQNGDVLKFLTGGRNKVYNTPYIEHPQSYDFLYTLRKKGNAVSIWVNGGFATSHVVNASHRINSGKPFFLGSYDVTKTNQDFFSGLICEYLVFNEDIPVNKQQLVEGYLAHKWGQEALLKEIHPYRYRAPLEVRYDADGKGLVRVEGGAVSPEFPSEYGSYQFGVGDGAAPSLRVNTVQRMNYAQWAQSYGLPANSRQLDRDKDGFTNFEEYAFNGDPLSAERKPQIELLKDGKLRVPKRFDDPSLRYQLKESPNLRNWQNSSKARAISQTTDAKIDNLTFESHRDRGTHRERYYQITVED